VRLALIGGLCGLLILAGCSRSIGGCLTGEAVLHNSGTVQTPEGTITLVVPPGSNAALCTW
jgi:hypothetical protein